jgi:hypothetical protein
MFASLENLKIDVLYILYHTVPTVRTVSTQTP